MKGGPNVRGNPIDNGQFKSILFLFFQRGRKGFLQQQDSRLCLTSLYSASSRVADKKCSQCRTRGDLLNTFATSSLSLHILIVNEFFSKMSSLCIVPILLTDSKKIVKSMIQNNRENLSVSLLHKSQNYLDLKWAFHFKMFTLDFSDMSRIPHKTFE